MSTRTLAYILHPVDRNALHTFCTGLLTRRCPTAVTAHVTDTSIVNNPGQGLAAWLLIEARDDGTPLPLEPDDDNYPPAPSHHAVVAFDSPSGAVTDQLHRHWIAQLQQWCTQQGNALVWRDEPTATLHTAPA